MWNWLQATLVWLSSSPEKVSNPGGIIYRVQNAYLALGLLSTPFFAIMGLTSVVT